jgi:hypothetical protein
LTFDTAGDLFVADNYGTPNSTIVEITPYGTQSTFAFGSKFASGLTPVGLAFNNVGDLFEADSGSGDIYKFAPDGTRTTFASGPNDPVALAFQPVPEPSAFGLLAAGIVAFLFRYRRLATS